MDMRDAGCRPVGRLCCWVLLMGTLLGSWVASYAVGADPQSGLATTTVADTVYLADGTPAAGSLIITWPAFVTASGAAVAAGTTNATLGAGGALSVALVPNAGASPAGSYYTVIYQFGPGSVKTEIWVVPPTSPATLAEVRATAGAGIAGQPVSMQYVNSELAAKANDNSVVHTAGDETISGNKTFAIAPNVPAATSAGQVATKGYVDSAVSNVGAGNYLPTAGGTMTGPITLPANPSAPLQASPKQYVDSGLAGKADLISGLVPASELGTGQASAGNCLLGNGTWAPCGAGGTGNVSTTPASSQAIAQPAGTQFSVNNLANIRYVTGSWNWSQTPSDDLLTPGNVTIHLSPCPLGLDTASSSNYYIYKVYIAGTGTAEAVAVTGGNCTPGASSGTITVTTSYTHAAGYTVGSASSGIQEAWNDAWTSDGASTASNATAPYVKLMADTNYYVYASVYLRGRGGMLDGAGALIFCSTRDRCIYIGTTQGWPQVHHHKLYNLTGVSSLNVDGVQIASVSASSGLYTVGTATTHPFVAGDVVDCEWYSQSTSQHFVQTVLSSGLSANQFQLQYGRATFSAGANTFGYCGLLNAFIENNSDHVALQDVNVTQVSTPNGAGQFSYGIVNDNDQQFIIERAANRSFLSIRSDANFPMGAFIYQRTDAGSAGITYVHDSEFSNVNCIQAGGNGLVYTDSVCQGFPVYGVRYFGGLQPSTYQNIYQESTGGTYNPLYGNIAAQMGYLVQGGLGSRFIGEFPINGYQPGFAMGGPGTGERNYFVVPRSSTQGYGPMMYAGWAQPTSGSTNITVRWPSIELMDSTYQQSLGTLTWDVLVVTGQSATTPLGTGTYAIATNVAASCGTNGMCSFTDTQSPANSYTVPAQQFVPVFWFWPTGIVLNGTTVFTDVITTDPGSLASQGASGVSIVAQQCVPGGLARRRMPIWVSCLTGPSNGGAGFSATLLQQQDAAGNGPFANSKGRVNFGKQIGAPNDLITLADSNFLKTIATVGERPSNDAGDMAIGVDQTGGMLERAATSISSYINAVPSGTNFLERLTAAGKTFNVPVTVNGGLTVSGGNVTLPITGTGPQCLHVSAAGVISGTGADCGSGSGSGTVNTGAASQVAMYSASGSSVSGDSGLTDNGTTLNYLGAGGIGAAGGSFSGNVTVNGQLQVAGPWAVSSPIPGIPMASAGAGTSSLGISNDGNFYISANGGSPQKVATSGTSSYFSDLWQEDPNTLGAYNGTNPQGFHVYGTYGGVSNYERTGLGWDQTDGYFVVRNENSGTGQQRGIGFWIGSAIRWGIDTQSAFKPFLTNSFDVGTFSLTSQTGLVPRTVYAGTSFDSLTQGRLNFELCNDSTTGTMQNFLARYSVANPGCAVKAGTGDTDGIIGVVSNGSGTSGNVVITYRGYATCSFDPSSNLALGDYVVVSTTNPGDCHDAGASRPTGMQVVGRVESMQPGSGTYGIRVSLDAPEGNGGGGVGTVNSGSANQLAFYSSSGSAVSGDSNLSDNGTTLAYGGKAVLTNTGAFLDASLVSGATLDVKLNAANAYAITSGNSTIDARALGGAQTIASEVSVGELRPPALSSVSGSSPGAGTYKLVYTLTSPTASETSASMESTITVDGSHAIQVASPTYYGTASSYSVYMTAMGGSSWTESKCAAATNVAIGTAATISATCSGATVSKSNNGFGVSLIPPKTGVWTVTIADTVTNTSCGIKFFDGSNYEGAQAGEGRSFWLTSTSATNVEGLWCTDPNPKWGAAGYYNIRGIAARGTGSDHIQVAPCVMRGTADESRFDDIQCGSQQNYPTAVAYGSASLGFGASTRISGQFEGNSTACPVLQLGSTAAASMGSTDLHDISVVHPGNTTTCAGKIAANIAVLGGQRGLKFTGTLYMEGPASGSCGDAIQLSTAVDEMGANIDFDSVLHGAFCNGTSAYMFSVPTASYRLGHLSVSSTNTGNFTNLFNYAPNSAWSIAGVGTNKTYPYFVMDNNNPVTMQSNLDVNGSTSLASATATTPTTSDNSNNVATTAFVKGQGYASLASPALTGTPTAPTASFGTNNTQIATTAMVASGYATGFLTEPVTGNAGVVPSSSANKALLWGIMVTTPVSTSKIMYTVRSNADNTATNNYDLGLYNSAGALVLNLSAGSLHGSTFAPGIGPVTLNWQQGNTLLQPGKYYLAYYSSLTTAPPTLSSPSGTGVTFYKGEAGGTGTCGSTQGSGGFSITPRSGGILPTSITAPTDSPSSSACIPAALIYQ
jgi:hypothetical protein